MTDSYEVMLAEEEAVAHVQAMMLRLLTHKNMSRSDLAEAMGVTPAHVSQLLGDEPQNLSVKKAARVFQALGEELVISCAGIEKLDQEAAARNSRKAALLKSRDQFSWLPGANANDACLVAA